jgi:hypothetical protein
MTAANVTAIQGFLNSLQCPKSICPPIASFSIVLCESPLPYINCDNPAGAMLSIENIKLSGTINGQFFKNMGGGWVGLSLKNNSLSGTIPRELIQLPNLRFVLLENNLLNGTLPSALSTWSQSDKLFSVSSNRLSGTLPSGIFSAGSYSFFRADDNQLSGTIPSAVAQQVFCNDSTCRAICSRVTSPRHCSLLQISAFLPKTHSCHARRRVVAIAASDSACWSLHSPRLRLMHPACRRYRRGHRQRRSAQFRCRYRRHSLSTLQAQLRITWFRLPAIQLFRELH